MKILSSAWRAAAAMAAVALATGALAAPGQLDATFGTGGIVRTRVGATTDIAVAAAKLADGRYVVLATSDDDNDIAQVFVVTRHQADGTLDTSFGSGGVAFPSLGYATDTLLAMALQADGKVVLAGRTAASGNDDFALIRLNANGSMDTGFGCPVAPCTGRVTTSFGPGGDIARALAIQADGRIIAAGSSGPNIGATDFALARYQANGTLDTSWGCASPPCSGMVTTSIGAGADAVYALLIQPDGMIVAGGNASDTGGFPDFALARYNTNGTLDAGFNATGTVRTAIGPNYDIMSGLALDAGGRIVAVGTVYDAGHVGDFGVARYLPAGGLDTTFNTTGMRVIAVTTGYELAKGVRLQADGAIVAFGTSDSLDPGTRIEVALARLTAEGALDTTFNASGIVTTSVATGNDAGAVALFVQGDGRLAVVGTGDTGTSDDILFLRYNGDGSLDESFGDAGKVYTNLQPGSEGWWNAVAIQSDGRIVAAGVVGGIANHAAIARFLPGGAPDTTFGTNGIVVLPLFAASDMANDVAVDDWGRPAVTVTSTPSASDIALARLGVDGSLDTQFAGTGTVVVDFGGTERANALAILPDGKLLVTGNTFAGGLFLARFLPSGTLDTGFGCASPPCTGRVVTNLAWEGRALAVQPDGRIVVAGDGAGGGQPAVARFLPGGTLDDTFGCASPPCTGITVTTFSGGGAAHAVALQPDGRIVIAGGIYGSMVQQPRYFVLRHNADGTPDATFAAPTGVGNFNGVAVLPNGRIVAAGGTLIGADTLVIRLTASGALDTTFNGTGSVVLPVGAFGDQAYAMALQRDGRVVLAGGANEAPEHFLARVLVEETPDALAFAPQANVAPGTEITSNAVVVSGLGVPASISVDNGTYSIGCTGVFTSSPGSIANGQAVCVRHMSSLDPLQGVTTTLYVGTASAPFNSITILPLAGDFDGDGIPNGVEIAEGRDPLVKDNDIFSPTLASARLFAMQQYRDFVNREADLFGLNFWSNAVFTGAWTRPAAIDAFLSSQEFAGFVAPVVRLYFATFLRVPDYAGLDFNAGLVRNGTVTLTQLADFFTASPEFVALYGALDNTQFVTLLYANVLGRVPDPAGLSGWVALLNGGYTRGQVLLGFSDSVEYQAVMANEVFVTMMYSGMLRRTAEPSGFTGWLNFLDAGTFTREQVINGFFLSSEYRARFLPN